MTLMKILVIANEIVDGSALEPDAQVFVVAPALNSRLRHWLSDVDGARRDAERRLARTLELLARGGVVARGRVGDSDPLQAVADALPFFEAESILVSGLGNWLARDLVRRVRERFRLPVAQLVVDGNAPVESTRPSARMLIAS